MHCIWYVCNVLQKNKNVIDKNNILIGMVKSKMSEVLRFALTKLNRLDFNACLQNCYLLVEKAVISSKRQAKHDQLTDYWFVLF